MSASSDKRGDRAVLAIAHARYPFDPRVAREAHAARDAGYQVDIICLRGPREPSHEKLNGVQVHRLPFTHRRGAGILITLWEYLGFTAYAAMRAAGLMRRRRFSVVQVHAPPDFLILSAIAPKLMGARVALDIHDLSPHLFAARVHIRGASTIVVAILKALQRAACAISDLVITVHEPYQEELVASGVRPAKVRVVMNSTEETAVVRAGHSSRSARADQFTVAYHGTLTHWYGVDLIIDALGLLSESLPQARAVILGGGDALPGLVSRADELGLTDHIQFSGEYVPLEAALRTVMTANCGVIPNRPNTLNRFALSSKLFDYVALGVPAVVAGLPTLMRHFDNDEVTVFAAGDAAALASALEWVAAHPVQARSKAARARRRYEAYSWTRQSQRYVAALQELSN